MFGNILWCSGTGTSFLLNQTRSPKTAFDAQLFVDFGFGNSRGLIQTQPKAATTHTIDHHRSQTLLQNAKTNIGSTEYRVQTLNGLACLSQTLSDIEKTFAINSSIVCAIKCPTTCHCISVDLFETQSTLPQIVMLSSRVLSLLVLVRRGILLTDTDIFSHGKE